MNRAERRKLQKQGVKTKTEPTLNLKVNAFNEMVAAAQKDAKDKATAAAIHEIDQQILERDTAYSLDIDAMILWTLHVHCGFGKKRLEEFYEAMADEHLRMRKFYEMDDTFPERHLLKERCGVNVEALNAEFVKRANQQ